MTPGAKLRRSLDAGRTIIGMTVQMASTDIVELVALAGYDFAMLDAEHGAMDIPVLANMILAADARGIPAMVRVPDATPAFISRVMDAGAAGVVVPNVRSRAEAQAAVHACHLAPHGRRGACATARAANFGIRAWADHVQAAPHDGLVWLLIEDTAGLDNADDILAVPGVDAVGLGAFDLAQSLGLPGQTSHERVRAGFDRLRATASGHGTPMLSVPAAEPGGALAARQRRTSIVIDGFDVQVVLAALRGRFQQTRETFAA